MGILLRNWHLKLSAVLLATVLYTGLVFSDSFSESSLQVEVELTNASSDTYVLTGDLGFVEVRYRTTNDLVTSVSADAFRARVDLGDYDLDRAPEPQQVPVQITTDADGVQIVSFEPRRIRIEVDRIATRTIPVEVDVGEVPEGLEIGTPQLSDDEVQVRGPASIVGQVDRAVAFIAISASGIDFNEPVTLRPVDISDQPITGGPIEIDPETVSVTVDVEVLETSKTVPVDPQITGTPAAGFALEAISVEPSTVVLRGVAAALEGITQIQTEEIDISGADGDSTFEAALVLPPNTRVEGAGDEPSVTVTTTVGPSVSSRTFRLGLVCQGAGENACLPGFEEVSVTLSGPGEVIAALSGAQLTPILNVGGLTPGTYNIQPAIAGLPEGVVLLSVSPISVPVIIQAPALPTPTPVPSVAP